MIAKIVNLYTELLVERSLLSCRKPSCDHVLSTNQLHTHTQSTVFARMKTRFMVDKIFISINDIVNNLS